MSHGWFLQLFVHDMGVDQALLWVLETIGCGSNDGEAMLLPQGDRGLVGAHYDVELYRQKSQASSFSTFSLMSAQGFTTGRSFIVLSQSLWCKAAGFFRG